jgi:hypothetical protein
MAQPTNEDLEQRAIDIRRERVASYLAKGYRNYAEISRIINVPYTTVIRDIDYLRDKANENLQNWVTNEIPQHVMNCIVFYDNLMKDASIMLDKAGDKDPKLRLAIMSFMKDIQHEKTKLISHTSVAKEILRVWSDKQNKLREMYENRNSNNNTAADDDDNQDVDTEIDNDTAAEEAAEKVIEK